MATNEKLPLSLKIAAALLIGYGIVWGGSSLLENWVTGLISLLCAAIGIGLLRRNRLCRLSAITLMVLNVSFFLLGALWWGYIWITGRMVMPCQSEFHWLFVTTVFLIVIEFLAATWILWVLTRPYVRDLFASH
jgi:hypothetical protein